MANLDRLLAATDFSAPSRHASIRAAIVAAETGAALDLLHVFNTTSMERLRLLAADMPQALLQKMLDHAKGELASLAAQIQEQHGIAANPQVVSGPLLQEIAQQAESRSADLLVLGARGESFMRHLLLGSTAKRMLGMTRLPILVVKLAGREPYRSVLVPVDFSASSLPALLLARQTAPGANLVLLHAFDVPFEGNLRIAGVEDRVIHDYRIAARQRALHQMHVLCSEAGLPQWEVRMLILHGDASRNIIEQEQELDCDLIVMGKQGESKVKDFLLGSVTEYVLAESQRDVLVSI